MNSITSASMSSMNRSAPMASDALRFMLDMDADVMLFIDRLREGCAAYVAGLRETL